MTREEFQSFVGNSQLSSDQKKMWADIMLMIDDAQLGMLAGLVTQAPENLALLTENIQAKKQALESQDAGLLGQVLSEEQAQIH